MDQLRLKGFEDLKEIGRGGFAVVYRARQSALSRDVAIKVLSADGSDPNVRRRFRREGASMGMLSEHPAIMQVHEAGVDDEGRMYLVMPLATGTLADRLENEGPLDPQEVAHLGVVLAGALETAHGMGVLHRDVKPANVLVDRFGDPRLGDLGISSVLGSTATKTGELAASIAYAPPEVIDGQRPEVAADVYSLGATLFTLLRGSPPFAEPDDTGLAPMLARVLTKDPPDLSGMGVPEPLRGAILTAMAKDPQDRYASCAAFGERLREVQGQLGHPVSAMLVLPPPDGHDAALDDEDVDEVPDDEEDGPTADEQAVQDDTVDTGAKSEPDEAFDAEATSVRTVDPLPTLEEATTPATAEAAPTRRWPKVLAAAAAVLVIGSAAGAAVVLSGGDGDGPENVVSADLDDEIFSPRVGDPAPLVTTLREDTDERVFEARAAGLWWGLADWCADEGHDRLGGCYDEAAEYIDALAGQDPRALVLTDEADRASVRTGLSDGYGLALESLDLAGAVPEFDRLVRGRPGMRVLCAPDCRAANDDLVAAIAPTEDPTAEADATDPSDGVGAPTDTGDGPVDEADDPQPTATLAPAAAPPPAPVAAPDDGCPFDTGLVRGYSTLNAADRAMMAPVVTWASAHNAHSLNGQDTLGCAWAQLTPDYRAIHGLNRADWDRGQGSTSFVFYELQESSRVNDSTRIARLRFVSRQDPSLGYQGQSCTDWSLTYRMVATATGWAFDERVSTNNVAASSLC